MIEVVVDEAGAVNESRVTTTRERTAQAIHYYNNNVLKARTGSKSLAYGGKSSISSTSSAGYHQRPQQQQQQRFRGGASSNPRPLDNLYRSNSSLELLHDTNSNEYHRSPSGSAGSRGGGGGRIAGEYAIASTLRREYGSHGSIDVISIGDQKRGAADGRDVSGEQFLSMLQDYKPAVFDLVSTYRGGDKKCPSSDYDTARRYHRKSADSVQIYSSLMNEQQQQQFAIDANSASLATLGAGKATTNVGEESAAYSYKTHSSPKQKSKFPRFWSTDHVGGGAGGGSKNTRNDSPTDGSANTSFTNYVGGGGNPASSIPAASSLVTSSSTAAANNNNNNNNNVDVDEKQRRRAFAHYDCQSLVAKLGFSSKLKSLLSKRRNTTTGASAASMLTRSLTPDGDSGEEDGGDGRCNDLIESCPFFRNEIGGEEERIVSLTRSYSPSCSKRWKEPHHRPPLSCGVSVLEYPVGETHWTNGTCPGRRNTNTIENVDEGALYYRKYFSNQDHQNWFGLDETLGPVAISFKREKVDAVVTQTENNNNNNNSSSSSNNSNNNNNSSVTQLCRYRLIVRTSELQTLRGSVLEDAILNSKPSHSLKNINTKEVLEYVIPEIQLSCLRLGMNSPQVEEQLLKLDEQRISRHYKIGVLYCRAGQATEEEMYNNEDGGPAFNEFLETIGQKVRLKGFDKYKAGLDNKSDSTGLYSIYAQYKNCEIMFHVSTMLPFTPNNRQQLLRKRHIGNDIVTIVFQEPGAQPFTPKNIRSQFQHVFIVVQAVNPCTDCTQYRVAVTRSKDVELFGPPIPKGSTLNRDKNFAEFLLAKVINGENAAHCSDKFATMATRTRQAYLKDLTLNYSTNSVLESTQKFSIIPFSAKKKERWRPRFVPDATQRGAICWQVMLDDGPQSIIIHSFLAISTDSIVLIDENTNEIVFVTPCSSVLGWLAQTNSLRLYYHEGECITMHMRASGDRDELMEVVARLKSVTSGCAAEELSLKRNPVGQLGFHVQPEGLVTQVENMGLAWQAGLRQGSRLVEICRAAVATLTHDQMVDLLKTSLMVTVAVIPPLSDGCPRRGCSIMNCKYESTSDDVNYEACSSPEEQKLLLHNTASLQQPIVGKHKKLYERSFSPPRSSNSSGYGTGSSNKSFNGVADKHSLLNNNHSGQSNRNANVHSSNGESLLTSFSSNQSNEDCWYDVLDTESLPLTLRSNVSPPPLPARVLSGSGAAGSTNANRSLYKFASPSKMNLSKSLSMQTNSNSYSLPVVLDDSPVVGSEYAKIRGDFIAGEKVTCLMKAEQSHKVRRMLEKKSPHPSLKVEDYSSKEDVASSLPTETLKVLSLNDGHSTDTSSTSEKAFPPSEDELSVGSGGTTSPKPKSSTIRSTTSSSTGCSRNNSPRFKDTGEPRLRPGASARSSNRNSANLTSSTLQQDLMKLINPDESVNSQNRTTSEEEIILQSSQQISNAVSETNGGGGVIHNTSPEETNLTSKYNKENALTPPKALKPDPNSVIVTTARPATVISNTSSSSSQLNENFLSKEERLSLRVTSNAKHDPPCLPFPDTREMDWPSLVDTATKAMRQSSNEDNASSLLSSSSAADDFHWIDSSNEFHFSMGPDVESKENKKEEVQKYVELESRLIKETQRRQSLEQEVHSLRDENRRLQQESQNAAQQLRRFTEWFFQAIDKQ